jgi:hypothetical protein
MNTPNVGAGRLERRVRRWTDTPSRAFMDFALFLHSAQYAEYRYCALLRPLRLTAFGLRRIVACATNPPYELTNAEATHYVSYS